MAEPAREFIGTERYRLRRRIGAGGMGVVFEAHDREMDKTVALKTLTRAEPAHIYRFKKEFRALADVSHPNLVSLYEMMSDGKYWFFTMELVQGVPFIQYVRPEGEDSVLAMNSETVSQLDSGTVSQSDSEAETILIDHARLVSQGEITLPGNRPAPRMPPYVIDENRLRSALYQLADGVHHLHEMGKLHRDLKPSNVLVTGEGRVVVLDFGLVEDIAAARDGLLVGTPDYMSPEQGAQLAISKASDWYSVGVMLYEALTGQLPFKGRFFEVVTRKRTRPAVQPREINNAAPADLNDLCMRLLARDSKERPGGRDVLRALSSHPSATASSRALTPAKEVFVGREPQLAALNDAFAATRTGENISVYLHGESGMGKTALGRAFLDRIKDREKETVILHGRCYERESVPYKALDGVVDALSKHLSSLANTEAVALIPPNVSPLARVFPVMLQVDAIFNARVARSETGDVITLRRRAFAALRELLTRVGSRRPLIIYIDDLQWADDDSIFLLEDLLRPPNAPPLLLMACFRTEEIQTKPFLKALLQRTGTHTCREIVVGPLSHSDAHELTLSLFPQTGLPSEAIIDSIVCEAAGNPFLLEQLTRYAVMSDRAATAGLTLSTMIDERVKQLPAGSRPFLNTLAVAGRPVNQDVAISAAGVPNAATELLNELRAAEFIRSGGTVYAIELYHERIGETLASLLEPEERRQIHRRLAQAIEARDLDDPEALYQDYLGAGENDRATLHAEAAARKAASAFAFDRAALYYRRALALRPASANVVELKVELGEALANAGRPAQAATEFLDAAKTSPPRRALELQQRAGAQLLMGGHIEEGLEVFRAVLETAGFKIAQGPKRALLSLILRRLWIHLRGLEFTQRDAAEIPEADLFRIDMCWAIAAGLGAVDFIRSADFQSRHLLLALRAGELCRVSRAISFEAAQAGSRGGASIERAEKILRRAQELAQRVDQPHATGMYLWAQGIRAYLAGSWKKATDFLELSAEVFRDQCTGASWELGMAQRFMLSALLYIGDLAEVSRRVPSLLGAALEQGDVLAATDLRTRLNLIWLAADDPERARLEVIEALKIWPREGFHLQHYSSMLAMAQIELYTDDAEVAWKHVKGQYKELRESLLLRTQVLRVDSFYLQARTALAAAIYARHSKERDAFYASAERMATRIGKERMAWGDPLVPLILAPIAAHRGQAERAAALLSQSVEGFEKVDMHLRAMAAQRRLGQTLGGDRGRKLIEAADAWMIEQEIKKPDLMTRMLAPGWAE
jgi:tetratricopeptide (TPR) repeat protein